MIDPFFWAQPQPRIVQFQKRRFALRLESVFWQQLEKQAKRRNQRLGQLIAGLAETCNGVNLSSFVRGFCMVEAEKENARYRLAAGSFDLVDVLRASPSPALLLSHDRIIIETNPALHRWIEIAPRDADPIKQRKLDDVFEPRIGRSLDETVEMMRKNQIQRAQFQLAYHSPGGPPRMVLATMTGLAVGSVFYLLIWLTVNASVRITAM
jgi:predicted DNA-binding ribbon-helix-helix protein